MVNLEFFLQRVAKLSEQKFLESGWRNRWGLASGPERRGNASVSEHVMTRQDYKKS